MKTSKSKNKCQVFAHGTDEPKFKVWECPVHKCRICEECCNIEMNTITVHDKNSTIIKPRDRCIASECKIWEKDIKAKIKNEIKRNIR